MKRRRAVAKIIVPLLVLRETDKAYRVEVEGVFETWLPKSQVTKGADGKFVVPRWLAAEKGILPVSRG